jgi:hypothetical protein
VMLLCTSTPHSTAVAHNHHQETACCFPAPGKLWHTPMAIDAAAEVAGVSTLLAVFRRLHMRHHSSTRGWRGHSIRDRKEGRDE